MGAKFGSLGKKKSKKDGYQSRRSVSEEKPGTPSVIEK
jgi:hypothetical protein